MDKQVDAGRFIRRPIREFPFKGRVNSDHNCTTDFSAEDFERCSVSEALTGSMVNVVDRDCRLAFADLSHVDAFGNNKGSVPIGAKLRLLLG